MALVYLATNRVNGKQYVGFTTRTLAERRKEHETAQSDCGKLFRRAMVKYGPKAFVWETLAAGAKSDMLALESHYIAVFETLCLQGYNLTTGGESPSPGPDLRAHLSKKTSEWFEVPQNRAAASEANKRRYQRPGERERNGTRMVALWQNNRERMLESSKRGGQTLSLRTAEAKRQNPEFGRQPKDESLGVQVMDLRETGLSSRAVGKILGISHTHVLDIERGKNGWGRVLMNFVLAESEHKMSEYEDATGAVT